MGVLTASLWCTRTSHRPPWRNSTLLSGNLIGLHTGRINFPAKLQNGSRAKTRAFSIQNSMKKVKRDKKARKDVTLHSNESSLDVNDALTGVSSPSEDHDLIQDNNVVSSTGSSAMTIPTRSTVLTACTVTSGLIATLGILIRQASHVASTGGWPILDCSTEVSFGFEMWHLELITGLVLLISSFRYLLLKIWPDFSKSSEAANQQVLTSLQPLDYMVVAFLPGFSEEILFRGALLPLFGTNWKSALVVAAIFGFLHLGSGRKYSFAVWATFVGLLYGYATIISSSIIVPMASHAVNNLIGGILWRYSLNESE